MKQTYDVLTVEHIKAMWEKLANMRQPKYVVLVNANDPMRVEYERLGYETMIFEQNKLPLLEGSCFVIDKSKVQSSLMLSEALKELLKKYSIQEAIDLLEARCGISKGQDDDGS